MILEHSKYELGHQTVAVMIMCLTSPSLNCDLLDLIHIIYLIQQSTLNLQNSRRKKLIKHLANEWMHSTKECVYNFSIIYLNVGFFPGKLCTVLLAAMSTWNSGPFFLKAVGSKPSLVLRIARGYNFLNIHLNNGPERNSRVYL